MPITVNNFDRFRRDVHAEQRRRLERAAIVVDRNAKQLLSVAGTGVVGASGQVVRAVRRTRRTIYGAFPSRPGEPPRKQTGQLRRSVTREIVTTPRVVARVGTNVKYGKWLELGTVRILPRPWLVRAFREMLPTVRSILTAPYRWQA